MAFCMQCGQPTVTRVPIGDSLPREVCTHCGFIHYVNPKIICGALVTSGEHILLCRRAIEPCYGKWTLPAGFMELGETLQDGAARETREEAHAEITIEQLYCLYNIPRIGQVYVLFKALLNDGQFGAGEETIESRLFTIDELPWEDLAFPSVERTLRHFVHDRSLGQTPLPQHLETIESRVSG